MKQSMWKKLASNTLIFTVGKFVSKLIVIFMLPFYTAYLSSAEYSTADLITNLCNLLLPLACLGVSEGIFRNAAAKDEDKEAFFTNGILLMLIGGAGFVLLSPLLYLTGYFNDFVWLIICYVLASNLHSVCSQYVCAIGKTKFFALQGVINTLLTVTLNIVFLVGFDMGVIGYVLSVVLADFITTLIVIFVAKLYFAFKIRKISGMVMKDLLKFCLPLVPSVVFWWITGVSDRYMVAFMKGDEMNGLYTAAYKIPTLLTYVVTIFNDAWRLSAFSESDDREKCARFYSDVYKYYIAVMFVGGCTLAVTAQIFAKILFAESYFSSWIYIPILAAATVFCSLDTFLGSVYQTVKRTSMSLYTSIAGAAINVGLNLLLIPSYGAIGASIATFASYFLVYVLRAATMGRFLRFEMCHFKLAVNTVIISAIAVVMTLYGDGIVGVAIASGLLLASVVFNSRDVIRALKNLLSSMKGRKSGKSA